MIKLIQFEMRKLFRSKAFWICMLVALAIIGMSLATIAHMSKTNSSSMSVGSDGNGMVLSMNNENTFSGIYVLSSVLNIQIPLILSVFIPLFVASDFVQGVIKQLITRGYSKNAVLESKCLSSFIATTVITCVCLLTAGIIGTGIWGFGGDVTGKYVLTIFAQFLVLCAYSSFYLMLSVLIRKTGIAIAISVVSMTVLNMLVSLLTNVFKESKIADYHLPNMLANISNVDVPSDSIKIALIASLIYIVLFISVSFIHFHRKDIA